MSDANTKLLHDTNIVPAYVGRIVITYYDRRSPYTPLLFVLALAPFLRTALSDSRSMIPMGVRATNYPTLILTRVAATSDSTSRAANLIIVGTTDSSALILLSLNPSCYDHYGYACNDRLMFTTPVITCHDHNEYSENTHALALHHDNSYC